MTIVFFGFAPASQMTYSVTGAGGSSVPRTVVVSAYGTAATYLDQQWQPGTYTITATYPGGSVSATGVKTTSFAFAGAVELQQGMVLGPMPFELPDLADQIPAN
jgi:hypothetical protein